MKRHVSLFSSAAFLLLAGSVSAQNFNIDVGDTFSIGHPSANYGAGAGQAGFWNPVDGGPPYQFTLLDLNQQATTVTTDCQGNGGGGDFYSDNGATTGDDEALLDDLQDIGGVGGVYTWTFGNLADGFYDIYTYAWAPDNPSYITNITGGDLGDMQPVGGTAWTGTHTQGGTYARHCVTVSGGSLVQIEIANSGSGFGSLNGFQIVERLNACPGAEPGMGFCDCTNSTSACGTTGGAGNGCANGSNPAGAHLGASGVADTAADTVVLEGSGLVPGQPGLYFQGNNAINGGNGVTFGDGLRCAGQGVQRLQVRAADATGNSATNTSISVGGGVSPGDTKHYQLWYRDPAGSPCGTTFNLTNGYTIVWF
ncbi:MAG: hypothetical protein QF903_03120 [Planctomycetota bacterium]|jgi:hypothetical protein|nr:hypothetical protein [Planctomycetota bacterium]MDP6763602.1 hypothetical protein [Planctomycetota bacterium]MDP6988449.1 hypothetical protein [Planctomycetota bacterium]